MKKSDDYKLIKDKKGDQYFISPEDHVDFITDMKAKIKEYDSDTKEAIKARAKRIKELQLKTRKKRVLEKNHG